MRTFAAAVAWLLLLCPPALAQPPLAKVKAVASVLPVWALAVNVAGERAEVSLLVPPGADPHEFALKPSDARKLEGTDLVLVNGAGLEHFLGRLDPRKAVNTSEGIELIMHGSSPDPHVWLDPKNALRQVENIARALSAIDPGGRDYYMKNAEDYKGKLQALDAEMERGLSRLKGKRLITYHEAFAYFARRYGLRAHSLTGPDAEAPLPGRVRAVYDIVRAEKTRAVFEEPLRPGAMDRLARDLGVRVCALSDLTGGALSADLYEKTMRKNLEAITECLGDE